MSSPLHTIRVKFSHRVSKKEEMLLYQELMLQCHAR